jgi:hypothetical protein
MILIHQFMVGNHKTLDLEDIQKLVALQNNNHL